MLSMSQKRSDSSLAKLRIKVFIVVLGSSWNVKIQKSNLIKLIIVVIEALKVEVKAKSFRAVAACLSVNFCNKNIFKTVGNIFLNQTFV